MRGGGGRGGGGSQIIACQIVCGMWMSVCVCFDYTVLLSPSSVRLAETLSSFK